MHSAVVPFRNTVIPKGINIFHLCNFCYKLGVWFITTLLCNNINRNDMLGLLLDVLHCTYANICSVESHESNCLDSEHLY